MPPSPLQLVPSLLASPTPSPAQPLSLGEEHCPPPPPSHGSTPVGVWHQGLVALLTSPSTHFKCLTPDSTPAMSVCPHHSSLELRVTLRHSPSMCRVSTKWSKLRRVTFWLHHCDRFHVLALSWSSCIQSNWSKCEWAHPCDDNCYSFFTNGLGTR